jgi:hypothetical protein
MSSFSESRGRSASASPAVPCRRARAARLVEGRNPSSKSIDVTRLILPTGVLALLSLLPGAAGAEPRINAPYFSGTVPYAEAAVSWFGAVGPNQNYTDIRVAYTETELWVSLSVFDQWLFEDESQTRTAASLEQWDAATMLVDTSGTATAPASTSRRFVGELNWWRPRADYQAAYVGSGSGWTTAPAASIVTETAWRGDAPNTSGAGSEDRGWVITFHVPYAALGVSGRPDPGTVWRLGFIVHDKDSAAGPATNSSWPTTLVRDQPATWGQLGFGLRAYTAPNPPGTRQTVMIRHNLAGAVVPDAMVGGGTTCGGGNYFNVWGSQNHTGSTTVAVQNQSDVADWPCFSKIYVDFPLSALPANKVVVSARLTLYQFGGSDPTQAERSLVQVLTSGGPWSESTITWNNAPPPIENFSQSWVDVMPTLVPWPGTARTWDVAWAVANAYSSSSNTVRLVLYDADGAYHSGKYFTSSDVEEWDAVGRPTLEVVLGDVSGTAPATPTNLRVIPP